MLDAPLVTDEVPEGYEVAVFGLGCFWGAEEVFWQVPGVWSTSVGYAGGTAPHPSYDEVCSGRTAHTEAIRVVYDPSQVSYADLVKRFFEVHDPTQGMRQGNDVGTQYRSAIYFTTPEQEKTARELTEVYGAELRRRRLDNLAIEIALGALDDDELERALEIAHKRASQLRSYDAETAKRRLGAFLQRKGYSGSVVSTAVQRALAPSGGPVFR